MFRVSICPSSGEVTVSMRHWYLSLCMGGCLVCWTGEPPIQSDKYQCLIDTVSSPDDWAYRCPKHVKKRKQVY